MTGLLPQTQYTFTVKGVKGGRASDASAPVTMFTAKSGGPVRYEAEAPNSTLTGNAGSSGCTLCSGGKKIGNMGYDPR